MSRATERVGNHDLPPDADAGNPTALHRLLWQRTRDV